MLPRSFQSARCVRRRLYSTTVGSVQLTTLPNELRVATETSPGHFTAVGVYIDAGSRYETRETSGSSHFLDRMAFKSSSNLTTDQMTSAMDSLGGQIFCASSREAIMYQASHFGSATPTAMSLIAETIKNAQFLPTELHDVRESTRYEIRELQSKPEMVLPEILHQVAYGPRGLGNPLICPEYRIDLIDGDTLRDCMKDWYRPDKVVVAGAGVLHEELVDLAYKHFSSLSSFSSAMSFQAPTRPHAFLTLPNQSLSSTPPPKHVSRAASSFYIPAPNPSNPHSTYSGGHFFEEVPDAALTHIYIGFEGLPISDPDIYTLATLQFILGGGGSFSAGGPGKGMYSRLYTQVLNHHPEVDHCAAFHHIYTDSSLFGLFASFFPPRRSGGFGRGTTLRQVLPHLVNQFSLLLHTAIAPVELGRAKNQLKSSLMMALESRSVEVEDLGRQILVHGRKIPVTEMCERIDEVTADDVRRVSHRIFGDSCRRPVSVVVQGPEDVILNPVFKKYGVGGLRTPDNPSGGR